MSQPATGRMLLAVLLAALLARAAAGDVLVTKRGSRYQGTVTEQGESYVLTTPDGGRMVVPKSMVKEVIRVEDLKARFAKALESADLADDAQVEKLAGLAGDAGLVAERKKLLADAYAPRRAAAKGKIKALRALAKWCRKYELKSQAAACELDAAGLEFAARLAAAGKDAMALAKLSTWGRRQGLKAEADKAEAAALKIAPDDKAVRRHLGYVMDAASRKWVKPKRTWRITGADTGHVAPTGGGQWVLAVTSGGKVFLYVYMQFEHHATTKELWEFRVVDSLGKQRGKLHAAVTGKKAILIFSGSWSSLKGLYLQRRGLRARLPAASKGTRTKTVPTAAGDKLGPGPTTRPRRVRPAPARRPRPTLRGRRR